MSDLPQPFERRSVIGREDLERRLRASILEGAISNGWLLCGPNGAGKATLAYRMARAILDPAGLGSGGGLDMDQSQRTFRLVAAHGHPDLFVAEPAYDEKTEKQAPEISVETIRRLNEFLNKTAASGGWRAAIVDAGDDLNRNAANALLKSLEEPPQRSVLLIVAHQPGRLLATIRSRCRRIDLREVAEADIVRLLSEEAGLKDKAARLIAAAARGRPGRALQLAAGEGAEAIELAEQFLGAASAGGVAANFASNFGAKAGAEKWPIFAETLLERMADRARERGRAGEGRASIGAANAAVEARAALAEILRRGAAVNMDRGQMLHAMSRVLAGAGA